MDDMRYAAAAAHPHKNGWERHEADGGEVLPEKRPLHALERGEGSALCLSGAGGLEGAVLDAARARRVLQRGQRLVDTLVRRAHAGDQHSARGAAERVLQDARELAVAVRHVLGRCCGCGHRREGHDDVGERMQALVDLTRLLCGAGERLREPLGACQVDELDFGGVCGDTWALSLAGGSAVAVEGDGADGMGAAGLLIHVCAASCSLEQACMVATLSRAQFPAGSISEAKERG